MPSDPVRKPQNLLAPAAPAAFPLPTLASGGAWKVNVTVAPHFLPLPQIDVVQAVQLPLECLADFTHQGRHELQVELQPHTRKGLAHGWDII